jgi:O-antigen ligase
MILTYGKARSTCATAALVYGFLIIYVSLVLGPIGFNFHPIDLSTAWRAFLATRFDVNDPLLSSDWNSNLLMFVPLGALVTGTLWPSKRGPLRWLIPILALGCCVIFLLGIKFAQLYFPPRTVSVNYIIAQSAGSFVGVVLFISLNPIFRQIPSHARSLLTVALSFYAVAFVSFMLFPFDFIINDGDLHDRLAQIPSLLFTLPGQGRSLPWRALFLVLGTVETVPLGLLITLSGQRRSIVGVTTIGLVAMSTISLLQLAVASATPSGLSILYHTLGIVSGAVIGMSMRSLDLVRWRLNLARAVPALAPLYLLVLLVANEVAAATWRTSAQAWQALDTRGLLPFWHDYIVSKSHALQSVIAHAVMYAPIGIMIWLRRGGRPGGQALAAVIAAPLAFAIEVARWFRPELQPDFSNVLIAGTAAAVAVPLSAWIWGVLEGAFAPVGASRSASLQAAPISNPEGVLPFASSMPAATIDALGRRHPRFWLWRVPLSAACTALAAALLIRYPLTPWPLAIVVGLYAAALWRWRVIWLLVVPMVLPAVDLAPWTGWLYFGEADLFILMTIAVLLLVRPASDARLPISKFATAALLLACVSYGTSIAMGVWVVPAFPTDNPYLSTWNGLRIAKGFLLALALFPFLRREIQTRANTLAWLGAGVVGGLLLVASAVIAERLIFVSPFDFANYYRVSAPFSSMHVGGGHIGAYLAMTIPFLSICALKPRVGLVVGIMLSLVAVYALAVTYARTAYAAALVATAVLSLGWALAAHRTRRGIFGPIAPWIGVLALASLMGAFVVGSQFMRERFADTTGDLATREANWASGLDVSSLDLSTAFIGTGLGTFPRIYRARATGAPVPTDFVVRHDDEQSWLVIKPGPPSFFFGQKVAATAEGPYTLTFDLRASNNTGSVNVSLCEKLLLYSDHCSNAGFTAGAGPWAHQRATLQMGELSQPVLFGLMRRPVELAFQVASPETSAEITAVRLLDPQQHDLIRNGEFTRGTDRWYFTSDDHRAWRIFNQYLMIWFEQGALGLISFICLCAAALLSLWRTISAGNRAAAPFAAAIVAYLCCGVFDFLLEAPRLSTLFYLFCFVGLALPEWTRGARTPNERSHPSSSVA